MKTITFLTITLLTTFCSAVEIERLVSHPVDGVFKKISHPEPKQDEKIVLIQPELTNYSAEATLEVKFSRKIKTDTCNSYFIFGSVETLNLEANSDMMYYVLTADKEGAKTKKGCANDEEIIKDTVILHQLETFRIHFAPHKQDNLVFYVPKDVDVFYRLWKPEDYIKVNVTKVVY